MEQKKFILSFEDYFKENREESPWKKLDEIASLTGETTENVTHYVESFDEFVRNSRGEYTTRKLYEEKSPFIKKIIDQIKNRID